VIEPTTQIAVTMSAQQWGVVLEALSHAPYRVVAPIFTAIQQQCMEHDSDIMIPGRTPGGANGGAPTREGA
jgi:hypothetical protein